MFQFLKRVPLIEDLIRRNPIYYAQFRNLLDEAEAMDQAGRAALRDALLARMVGWVADVRGYSTSAGIASAAEYPVLTKDMLQAHESDYRARNGVSVAASTGGSSTWSAPSRSPARWTR